MLITAKNEMLSKVNKLRLRLEDESSRDGLVEIQECNHSESGQDGRRGSEGED